MKTDNFFGLITALFFIIAMFLYFILNSSYHKSIQAKYYYVMGDYHNAYKYADEAYKQESYNLMAYTIKQQSSISIDILKYTNQAEKYFQKIDELSSQSFLSITDKRRMLVYARIVVEGYDELVWTALTDKDLIKKAGKLRDEFDKLLQELLNDTF